MPIPSNQDHYINLEVAGLSLNSYYFLSKTTEGFLAEQKSSGKLHLPRISSVKHTEFVIKLDYCFFHRMNLIRFTAFII